MEPVCGNCRYSSPDPTGDLNCRCNPPTAFVMVRQGDPYVTSAHPIVAPDGWCGHWTSNNQPLVDTVGAIRA